MCARDGDKVYGIVNHLRRLSFAFFLSIACLPVEVIHKVMVACRGRVVAGNYAVASIVHNLVAFDGGDSFVHQVASTAVANAVVVEADSYAEFEALAERSSVDVVAIVTPIQCPTGERERKKVQI